MSLFPSSRLRFISFVFISTPVKKVWYGMSIPWKYSALNLKKNKKSVPWLAGYAFCCQIYF